MKKQGYDSIMDFKGVALKHITLPEKIKYSSITPTVDASKCNGCGVCVRLGHCEVYALKNGKAKALFIENCLGCGVCQTVCPTGAISYKIT
jgi:dihydropyrimidine dehydrogenase (NAD+) subunit PreA